MRQWCEGSGRPVGQVVPLHVVQRLARLWYRNRLDADWRPRTLEESQQLLRQAGLAGGFWDLQAPSSLVSEAV